MLGTLDPAQPKHTGHMRRAHHPRISISLAPLRASIKQQTHSQVTPLRLLKFVPTRLRSPCRLLEGSGLMAGWAGCRCCGEVFPDTSEEPSQQTDIELVPPQASFNTRRRWVLPLHGCAPRSVPCSGTPHHTRAVKLYRFCP